jgi:hypothetical protein
VSHDTVKKALTLISDYGHEHDDYQMPPKEVRRLARSALAALASIEERLAELESELTDSEINFRDQLDRARAAERERDEARQLYIEDVCPGKEFLDELGWPGDRGGV